jgi:hypothetical protein
MNRSRNLFYEELDSEVVKEWKDYFYITSIAFMLTKQYRHIFKYQWILRVDQDADLTPALIVGLLQKHPVKLYDMQFGDVGHGTDFTLQRLRKIRILSFLIHSKDSIEISNLTMRIGRYFSK